LRQELNITTIQLDDNRTVQMEIIFPQVKAGIDGTYTCQAENIFGQESQTFTLQFPTGNLTYTH
jgi:hypothetical protein